MNQVIRNGIVVALLVIVAAVAWRQYHRLNETASELVGQSDQVEFDARWAPWEGQTAGYFVALESVPASAEECTDELLPPTSPYTVNFGDGSSVTMADRGAGYGSEGTTCSVAWHISHSYAAAGVYTATLIRNGQEVAKQEVTIGNQ